MQRAVNKEAKTGLKSSAIVQDLDVYCPKDHRLSHNTSSKVQTQGSKNFFHSKEPKPKDSKFASSHDNTAESVKKKGKKKKRS